MPVAAQVHEAPSDPPPYPMSWLDRLIDWIERLPGPPPAFYLLLAGASVALFVGVQWVSTGAASTQNLQFHVFFALQPTLTLGMAHAVRTSARRSLAAFRPVLANRPDLLVDADYRVTNAPARGVLLASVVLVAVVPPAMLGVPQPGYEQRFESIGFAVGPASLVVAVLYAALLAAVIGGYAAHLIHQLRTIARFADGTPTLDLYRLEPVYAFSRTTALAAILLTIDNYLWYVAQPLLLRDPFSLVMGAMSGLLALAAFAWPLWGVHRLLAEEKGQALARNGAAFKALASSLHEQVGGGRLEDMDRINKAMASLDLEQATLSRIPTWPWHTETLRTILAAIFLPIIVWLAQYLLGRVLGA